jgi:RNA polymerase-binding transcription factor DksA
MTNIPELKIMLLEEKARLESALSHVGFKNPEIEGDWQPAPADLNEPTADSNDVASGIEVFEENAAIEVELEARLLEVDAALVRMEATTYGICRVCNSPIEDARLHANPAAATCIAHREG